MLKRLCPGCLYQCFLTHGTKRLFVTKENQIQSCKKYCISFSFRCYTCFIHNVFSSLCLPKQSWCYHTSLGHDQPPSLPGLHDWSSVTLKTRGEIISLQEGDNTWLPLSLIVKPAVPATILPWSEAPSRASSRIVTGTDIIPLWKFWGSSALIWETNKNQYAIITIHLPAMRKSIIQPLHQLLAPDP